MKRDISVKELIDLLNIFLNLSRQREKGIRVSDGARLIKETKKHSVVKDSLNMINLALFFTIALKEMLIVR